MEKKRNLWVIPTDKPSRVYEGVNKELKFTDHPITHKRIWCHNIYITSDEIPKLDEWGINTKNNVVFKCKGFTPDEYDKKYCKKIILTTDMDLIKDNVQSIDDDFLQWFVKNPSYEKVKIDKSNLLNTSRTYLGVDKYKIIIPKEEPKQERERGIIITHVNKQETLEESFDRIYNSVDFTEFDFASFKLGAKWQTERSYSQEEAELECLKKLISIVKSNEK